MKDMPSSSKLLGYVVRGLEDSSGPPDDDRLRAAIRHANKVMPQTVQVGLVADSINYTELVRQTIDLGIIFKFDGMYMLTEKGRKIL